MAQPLRVLILEDQPFDARLIISELKQAGFEPTWERVETEQDFLTKLDSTWDVVLADYTLPQFDGLRALRHMQQRGLDTPFILISGSIGEEMAVSVMKEGAADYLLKDRLGRLGQAVTQAMDQRFQRQVQQHAAETIRQSELWFRATFNQTFEFLGLLDQEGTILEVNQPALDLRRLALASLVGRPFWDMPWFDATIEVREQVRQAVVDAAAGKVTRGELTLTDANAARRIFDFLIKPILNELGIIELILVEGRDITDQKSLEEQFRQAQKMEAIGKLAGGVAHDFNNLLTIILGYSDMLQDSLPEGDPLREYVEEIDRAGHCAAELTRRLLAFSRKQILAPVVLDLNVLLRNMEKMLRRVIGEDIELVTRLADEAWAVRADSGQMEQVVMNLVVNARDAMPRGGKLIIEMSNVNLSESHAARHAGAQAGQHVQLAVHDTGCGIDSALLPRIFEPFFSTKGDRGTGLGLATVYGIVQQSGGHIAVESRPQEGTTFRVYIPRDAEGIEETLAAEELQGRRSGSETVLLVEDEVGVRSLARRILSGRGYRVLEAGSGKEALALCERCVEPIHLLATDVVMPGMSGRELAERLLQLRPTMKVLYMSGYIDDAILRHGLANADACILQKPYTQDSLAQKVRDVLDSTAGSGRRP